MPPLCEHTCWSSSDRFLSSPRLVRCDCGFADDILHVHSDGHLDLAKSKQITEVYQSVLDHFGYLLLRP